MDQVCLDIVCGEFNFLPSGEMRVYWMNKAILCASIPFAIIQCCSLHWHRTHIQSPESSVVIRAGCPVDCRCACLIFDQYCFTSEQDSLLPRTFSASSCQRPHRVQATILVGHSSFFLVLMRSNNQEKKGLNRSSIYQLIPFYSSTVFK